MVLQFASSAPYHSPWVVHGEEISRAIMKNSRGTVQVRQYHGGQLGSELAVLRKVVRGRVDIAAVSLTAMAGIVPEIGLMGAPFFWEDTAQIDCAMDTYLAPVFEPLFEEKGLKLLQWNELGFVHAFGKQPLREPADFEGTVMRASPSDFGVNFWQGMGAPAAILSLSDLSGALQSGMVDGGALAIPIYVGYGMARFAPHLTLSRHIYQSGALVMSLKRWNGYSPDTQRLILQSLRPLQSLRDDVRAMSTAILQQFEADGGQVHRLTSEQRRAWQARVRHVRGDFVASVGGRATEIWPLIQSARNKCTSELARVEGEAQ